MAEGARARLPERTVLFLDEVHRFNKAQQDLLLPFVEDGTLLFIGATTENPSFEVNGALRSRSQLYVLEPLSNDDVRRVLTRALEHPDGFNGALEVNEDALDLLAAWADGDARRALGALEGAAAYAKDGRLDVEAARAALSAKGWAFDKGGEHFYNLTSALHKSLRGCDPDAALYWLARALKGRGRPALRRAPHGARGERGCGVWPTRTRSGWRWRRGTRWRFWGFPKASWRSPRPQSISALAPKSNAVYRVLGGG